MPPPPSAPLTPAQASDFLLRAVVRAPVIPVLVLPEARSAVTLAETLVGAGLPVLEVTLRTPAALRALALMAQVPGAIAGAGTVLSAADAVAAKAAGAQFAVAPGATPALISACLEIGLPLLPGAATASEVMALLERGFHFAKFFPAARLGGPAALRDLGAPLPAMRFCPTGGITRECAPEWLALRNVACVGGSWVVPGDLLQTQDWRAIAALAREAAALR